MKVFLDCCAVLDATDNMQSFNDCKKQLDHPERMSSGMSILDTARNFGPNSGVVLYTNAHVEFNVRKALSQPRFDNRTGKQTRPRWSQSDIDDYCGFYKFAVVTTGGSISVDLAKDDPRIQRAKYKRAPDWEDAVVLISAEESPASVLCTADRKFRQMHLNLQWPEETADILELWSMQDVKEEVFCAVQAYLKNKKVAA